jgi:Methylamine utilisation protein MauE
VRTAAIIAAVLLTSFLYAICLNLARGRSLECHCFGNNSHRRISLGLAVQDSALLGIAIGIAIGIVVSDRGWWSLESWSVFHLLYLLPKASTFRHASHALGEPLIAVATSIIVALIVAAVLRVWPWLQARYISS